MKYTEQELKTIYDAFANPFRYVTFATGYGKHQVRTKAELDDIIEHRNGVLSIYSVRPYNNAKEFISSVSENQFLKWKTDEIYYLPIEVKDSGVCLTVCNEINFISYENLLLHFRHHNDSPCGIVEKELETIVR